MCRITWEIKINMQNWGFPESDELAWGGVLNVIAEWGGVACTVDFGSLREALASHHPKYVSSWSLIMRCSHFRFKALKVQMSMMLDCLELASVTSQGAEMRDKVGGEQRKKSVLQGCACLGREQGGTSKGQWMARYAWVRDLTAVRLATLKRALWIC